MGLKCTVCGEPHNIFWNEPGDICDKDDGGHLITFNELVSKDSKGNSED